MSPSKGDDQSRGGYYSRKYGKLLCIQMILLQLIAEKKKKWASHATLSVYVIYNNCRRLV